MQIYRNTDKNLKFTYEQRKIDNIEEIEFQYVHIRNYRECKIIVYLNCGVVDCREVMKGVVEEEILKA